MKLSNSIKAKAIIAIGNLFARPESAANFDIRFRELGPVWQSRWQTGRGKLMSETTQPHAENYSPTGNRTQARKQLREMNRMAMANRHCRSEGNASSHRRDCRQYEQALNVSMIIPLELMRLKNEMIPHPLRAEAVLLSPKHRRLDHVFRGLQATVRPQIHPRP